MAELKNLHVEEISLVDEGANPEAKILLFKRNTDEENPDEVFNKLAEKLSAQIEKAQDAQFLQVAKKYELLGEKTEELAAQLKTLSKSADVYQKTISMLDKALSLVEKSQLFEEVGKSGTGGDTADFEKICAEVKKNNPNLTDRWARDLAYQKLGVRS